MGERAQGAAQEDPNHPAVLLPLCAQGDQRAWSRLIARYSGLVYSIARQHALREDQCDDVAQQVFAALLRHVSSLRDPAALPAWLSQSTRRACWRLTQRERSERSHARAATAHQSEASGPLASGDPDDPSALSHLASIESAHRVRLALDDLGGRCRELLRALFVETTAPDYEVISARLGIPVGSIGPTRARCLAKLLALLEPADKDTRTPPTPRRQPDRV